jgi:hypothetical protein
MLKMVKKCCIDAEEYDSVNGVSVSNLVRHISHHGCVTGGNVGVGNTSHIPSLSRSKLLHRPFCATSYTKSAVKVEVFQKCEKLKQMIIGVGNAMTCKGSRTR